MDLSSLDHVEAFCHRELHWAEGKSNVKSIQTSRVNEKCYTYFMNLELLHDLHVISEEKLCHTVER